MGVPMILLAQVARSKKQIIMPSFKLPNKDGDLVVAFKNFSGAMETYASVLNFDGADEAATQGASIAFDTANTNATLAKDAAKGAVATKSAAKQSSSEIVRGYAQRIKSNPAATPEILAAFGFTPDPASAGPVQTPTMLSAQARVDGTCRITWKKNGNISGTTYVIETSANGTNWTFFATSTATRFDDTNATVGTPRWYRVRASRAGVNSAWSNFAVIYGGSSSGSLKVAA